MIPPINPAAARNTGAFLYSLGDDGKVMEAAVIVMRAIIDGRDQLGLSIEDARLFAAYFIGTALAEYDRLREQPPVLQ